MSAGIKKVEYFECYEIPKTSLCIQKREATRGPAVKELLTCMISPCHQARNYKIDSADADAHSITLSEAV